MKASLLLFFHCGFHCNLRAAVTILFVISCNLGLSFVDPLRNTVLIQLSKSTHGQVDGQYFACVSKPLRQRSAHMTLDPRTCSPEDRKLAKKLDIIPDPQTRTPDGHLYKAEEQVDSQYV